MVVAETTANIVLGDATMTDATEKRKIINALALQYNTTSVKDAGAEVPHAPPPLSTPSITRPPPPYSTLVSYHPQVSVTLYQEFSVTMTLETDLSEPQLCTVLTLALTLDAFSPTCAATIGVGGGVGGGGTNFLLTYPLEGDLLAVNAKTAQMRARLAACNPSPRRPRPHPRPHPHLTITLVPSP